MLFFSQEAEEKRRTHAASRPVKIEVVIPANQAGIVIGRRGENIQEIQRKTQCKINFKDERKSIFAQRPFSLKIYCHRVGQISELSDFSFVFSVSTATERFLTITGPAENAQLAEILIHQTIANQPRLETVIMEIPATSVGRVIGTGGQNIRSLQGQSHCKIDIAKGGYSNEGRMPFFVRFF